MLARPVSISRVSDFGFSLTKATTSDGLASEAIPTSNTGDVFFGSEFGVVSVQRVSHSRFVKGVDYRSEHAIRSHFGRTVLHVCAVSAVNQEDARRRQADGASPAHGIGNARSPNGV